MGLYINQGNALPSDNGVNWLITVKLLSVLHAVVVVCERDDCQNCQKKPQETTPGQ